MPRRWFGTDGVRGVVGESLTEELVERLGRAATLWSGRGPRPRRPRHAWVRAGARGRSSRAGSSTRAAPPFSAGVLPDAGGRAARAGPRSRRLRVAQPARVQRRQGLRPRGAQADGRGRARDRGARSTTAGPGRRRRSSTRRTPSSGYVDHVLEHFGSDLSRPPDRRRLRQRRLLGDRARACSSASAREVTALANAPDGANINVGCGATDLAMLQAAVARRRLRPRRRLRRRRRPDAGGRRDGRGGRRRPDRRDLRARRSASTSSPSRR